jgi:hypothetical protein
MGYRQRARQALARKEDWPISERLSRSSALLIILALSLGGWYVIVRIIVIAIDSF